MLKKKQNKKRTGFLGGIGWPQVVLWIVTNEVVTSLMALWTICFSE